jgi:hypothetical protein
MERGLKFGRTEPPTQETGEMAPLWVMECSTMQMVMSTQDNSKKTRPMAKVYMFIRMARSTMGNGKMISSMDSEQNTLKMAQSIRVYSKKGKKVAKAIISGQMAVNIKESGLIMISKVLANTHGLIIVNTGGLGK